LKHAEADIYGQRHPVESPALIDCKLEEFDEAVRGLMCCSSAATVLRTASERCPELLTDSFKLMFLRCECFDVTVRLFVTGCLLSCNSSADGL